MTLKKKLVQAGIAVAACAAMIAAGHHVGTFSKSGQENSSLFFTQKQVLKLWYTDEAYTDFLNSAAVNYSELQDQVRVEPELVSASEYLEQISRASVQDEGPDLFILSNESLEKAYLAGLALQLDEGGNALNGEHYPQAARNAVTYHGKLIGYPLSFETAALVYNQTYLEQLGESTAPTNIDEILEFADGHDAPENVEAFMRWDLSHIFYNYEFATDALKLGGDAGDDTAQVDLYNLETIQGMQIFQNLGQFFSIDQSEVSYDSVIQDFIDGKLIFTIATTDVINTLEKAREEGSFPYAYGISEVPDPSAELTGSALSVTNAVVVNGYSTKPKEAEAFADYLTGDAASSLYEMTGKMPANRLADLPADRKDKLESFYSCYEESIPMPKMMETSNFWVYFEIALINISDGADVNTQMRELSEKIMTQVTGETYTEEVIEVPETEEVVEEDEGMRDVTE